MAVSPNCSSSSRPTTIFAAVSLRRWLAAPGPDTSTLCTLSAGFSVLLIPFFFVAALARSGNITDKVSSKGEAGAKVVGERFRITAA
jgi:hypothetical protein